jgi:F0F1-type ATP synthase assembly protein I
MTYSARLQRRRCIGLRVGVVIAILLVALSWGDWPVIAVVGVGALLAVVVYWRDCRKRARNSAQRDTDSRAV